MDNKGVLSIDIGARRNKRKAYFAMCRVSLLLCLFTLFSWIAGVGLGYLFSEYSTPIQGGFVKVFTLLGMGKQTAVVAAKTLIDSPAFDDFLSMLVTIFTMVIPCIIFAKLSCIPDDECFNTDGKLVKGFLPVFCFCQLVTVTVSAFSQSIYSFILPDGTPYSHGIAAPSLDGGFDIFGFILSLLCVCVFVPVAEEYVFRGVIFSALRRYGLVFSVVASAAVFGVAHSSPTQSVYAFGFGLVSAFLVAVTGNIKSSVLMHAINNLIIVLDEYLPVVIGDKAFDIAYGLYILTVSALAFYGLYRLVVSDGYFDLFRQKAEENDGGLAVKPGIFELMAFPFVMYVIYYALTVASGVFG